MDYLDEDPHIDGQNWASILLCSPEINKCDVRGIICLGVSKTQEGAIKKCNEIKNNKLFNVMICETGKWTVFAPDNLKNKTMEDSINDLKYLNELVGKTKNKIDENVKLYKERKKDLILTGEDKQANTDNETGKIINNDNNEELVDIKLLVDFNKTTDYNYVCYSFCTPSTDDKNIWGIKIRGCFESKESAENWCHKLGAIDKYFDIYIGEIGKLHPYDALANSVEEQKYRNNNLQKLIDKHNEVKKSHDNKQKNQSTPEYITRKQELLDHLRKVRESRQFEKNKEKLKEIISDKLK